MDYTFTIPETVVTPEFYVPLLVMGAFVFFLVKRARKRKNSTGSGSWTPRDPGNKPRDMK